MNLLTGIELGASKQAVSDQQMKTELQKVLTVNNANKSPHKLANQRGGPIKRNN